MLRVALTGGIATGKSAVAARLAELGAVIIDADLLAREAVAPGTPGLAAVVARFGPQVLANDQLDRAALAEIIFADPAARADLEAIVHPAVRRRAAELEAEALPDAVVVHVIPLLVETGQSDTFDLCVVVDVDEQTQVDRLERRNGLTDADARARLQAQASREARLAAADVVIDNSGTVSQLREQVDALWARLDPAKSAG